MSEREGTGSKSTGRRLKASTASKRTITDSDYEEPGPPPKRRKAADNPNLAIEEVQAETVHNTLGHFRNRNIHEGVATRFEEVAGQVGSLGTRLPQVLAALNAGTAVGDQADLGQPILQEITMFGGNGGNGGNGFDRGIGGDGGVGEGPRLQIENFSGTQIIIRYMEGGGQVNPGIGRIGEGLANIRDGVAEVGGQMRSLINDLLRRFKTQLMAHIPRGVSDDLFHVMDPVGGPIAVSLRYCHDYATLDDILKGYLRRLPRAGGRYVERGDYGIVSENGSFMEPVKFAQTVKAGMLLEISILQRQVKKRSSAIQNTMCPSCSCSQATTTGNGWFKCTTCARNYRMDDAPDRAWEEEFLSPQLAQPNEEAERKLFRRVHIHIRLPTLLLEPDAWVRGFEEDFLDARRLLRGMEQQIALAAPDDDDMSSSSAEACAGSLTGRDSPPNSPPEVMGA